MLRKILEVDLGPMTDFEFREVLDLATSDIKTNRVDFGKRTSLLEVVEIAGICFRVHQRGKAVNRRKAGRKREMDYINLGETGEFNG